eukprot:GDKH01019260.1.p1 GENE.GDKH01019260.1~~GDKH01019260.1.p1  ORF type:complete len:73 (+),score=5.02 GDKH01019260.1:168-386(+)
MTLATLHFGHGALHAGCSGKQSAWSGIGAFMFGAAPACGMRWAVDASAAACPLQLALVCYSTNQFVADRILC